MPRPPVILHVARLATPHGDFLAHFSADGLAQLDFPARRESAAASSPTELPAPFRAWAEATGNALAAALNAAPRRAVKIALPPLDLSRGTNFRRRVWDELLRIPRGATRTYGELAEELGKRRAARAVGGACGAENTYKVLLVGDGILQGLGALQILGGFVFPETRTVAGAASPPLTATVGGVNVRVAPSRVATGYGLTAVGTF